MKISIFKIRIRISSIHYYTEEKFIATRDVFFIKSLWKITWNKINKLETTFWIISRVLFSYGQSFRFSRPIRWLALLNNLICLRCLVVALSSTAYITTWIIGIFEQHCGFQYFIMDTLGSARFDSSFGASVVYKRGKINSNKINFQLNIKDMEEKETRKIIHRIHFFVGINIFIC